MIDQHAHPFSLRGGPLDLSSISLDVLTDEDAEARRRHEGPTRLFHELLTTRLSAWLRCAPEELSSARDAASANWERYASSLFADAGITDLIVDTGLDGEAGTDVEYLGWASGCGVHPIVRLDPTVDRLIGEGASASEIVGAVERLMAESASAGAVGFKTILAYRTGLAVQPNASIVDASRSLADHPELPVRRRGKALRDVVLRRALGVAADLGRPFQIHTGFGDSDIRLAEANPLLLEELLRTPEGQAATIVLIHGAFPWTSEVAFLATVKPNVHAEISLSPIFAPLWTGDRLARLVDLAPTTKVLAGTDGHGEPEVFWFAAHVLRDAWRQVAVGLEVAGARHAWVEEAGRAIFEDNARRLYGL
jgi:hypothetical protein